MRELLDEVEAFALGEYATALLKGTSLNDAEQARIVRRLAALYQYLRADLGYESDLPYEVLTGRVHPWSYAQHENRYVDVADTLRKAIATNPHLMVYIANGYYDLATPHFATEYTISPFQLSCGRTFAWAISKGTLPSAG